MVFIFLGPPLNLACWEILHAFLSLFFFSKIKLSGIPPVPRSCYSESIRPNKKKIVSIVSHAPHLSFFRLK